MAETVDPPKIITITGPKEGVGKTLIALNLAVLRAGLVGRGVILIDTDPLCRGELLAWAGVTHTPTLKELLDIYVKVGGGPKAIDLIKGKIPFGQTGVATLPLGFHPREVLGNFSPSILAQFLRALGNQYDIFLDVEAAYAVLPFALEVSDWAYWVLVPQRQAITATLTLFDDLRAEHFPLDKIELIINQFDLPGAMRPREIEQAFLAYSKKTTFLLPWEEDIPMAANSSLGFLVRTKPNIAWVKALRFIANNLNEIRPKGSSTSFAEIMKYLATTSSFWKLDGPTLVAPESGARNVDGTSLVSEQTANGEAQIVDPQWNHLKEDIHAQVVNAMETQRIRVGGDVQASKDLRHKVEQIITNTLDKRKDIDFSREKRERFLQELVDEILGLGPLEELLRDPSITEVMVNAHDKIYVERKGKLTLTPKRFRSDDQLIEAIKRIVAPLGRRIDESVPLVDARLKDGSRVNAVIPPLAVSGPTLTIRRFSAKPLGAEDLIKMGGVTKEILDLVQACVAIKKNVVISGGTGSGKTTFLNLLSSYIPSDERILTIEDVAELRLQQEHWIRLESRPPNIEGKGEVTIRDLVKNSLRMRPDRIVVGECRGGEAVDMLQAMNTGHDGSMTTIHSNSPKDALNRMESMCLMSGLDLPIWVLREMIASAIHVICQLSRLQDGSRRIVSVVEVLGRDENQVLTQELFKFTQTGVDENGKVLGYHAATGKIPRFYDEFKAHGQDVAKDIFTARESANA